MKSITPQPLQSYTPTSITLSNILQYISYEKYDGLICWILEVNQNQTDCLDSLLFFSCDELKMNGKDKWKIRRILDFVIVNSPQLNELEEPELRKRCFAEALKLIGSENLDKANAQIYSSAATESRQDKQQNFTKSQQILASNSFNISIQSPYQFLTLYQIQQNQKDIYTVAQFFIDLAITCPQVSGMSAEEVTAGSIGALYCYKSVSRTVGICGGSELLKGWILSKLNELNQ